MSATCPYSFFFDGKSTKTARVQKGSENAIVLDAIPKANNFPSSSILNLDFSRPTAQIMLMLRYRKHGRARTAPLPPGSRLRQTVHYSCKFAPSPPPQKKEEED